jgi:hypothetical protein
MPPIHLPKAIQGLSGKFPGLTQSSVIFLRHVLTTARLSFGKSRQVLAQPVAAGPKSMNIHYTGLQVCQTGVLNGNLPELRPVNSVSWAPYELGAILACASSDGKISVLTFKGKGLLH